MGLSEWWVEQQLRSTNTRLRRDRKRLSNARKKAEAAQKAGDKTELARWEEERDTLTQAIHDHLAKEAELKGRLEPPAA